MLEPNIPGLRKLYDSYKAPRKPQMDMNDAIEVFYRLTGLLPQEKDVIFCGGMSKMTYPWETNHQDVYYN